MASETYEEVRSKIELLTPAKQLQLLTELGTLVRQQSRSGTRRSILELQGLGKEIWSNVDAQEYLDQERSSWNG